MPATVRAATCAPKRPRDGTSPSSRGGIHVLPAGDSRCGRGRYRRPVATLRARSLVFDAAVAVFALMVSLGAMGHGWNHDGGTVNDHPLDALAVGLGLVMALPLIGRRVWPVPVLAAVAPATGALYALDYGFPPIAFAVALYTVARWPDGTRAAIRN